MSIHYTQVGEGGIKAVQQYGASPPHFVIEEIIQEKKLTNEEASKCLNTLGKDESGVRYAYLMMTASEMKLTDISVITNYNHLLFVDVTGNLLNLEALQVLSQIPYLLYIRAERNRLESAALNIIPYLQVLILNKNAIIETGDINQPMLNSIELSDNQIFTVQFDPDRLESVREITLAGNHLLDTSGSYPKTLERLYLGRNKICKINTDFSQMEKLQVLHLRDNNIRKLSGFTSNLENLNYLNVRTNKINKIRQFRKLTCLSSLETLVMLDNPLYSNPIMVEHRGEGGEGTERGGYTTEDTDEDKSEMYGEGHEDIAPLDIVRVRLLALLPKLKRINKDLVTHEERKMAEESRQRLLDEIFAEESSEEETELATTNYTSDFTDSEVESGHPVSEQTVVDESDDGP